MALAAINRDSCHQDIELEALARRASRRFAWRWSEIKIADQNRRLAVASDPEGMLIDACERQDAGEQGVIDPFWATTWRAAAGLDQYLDRCGTGHAGLAAALRGGRVVLTDGVTDPLLLVRMSTWDLRERCHVRRLRFGIDRFPGPRFPIILGSDVTYLRQLWPELNECLKSHLSEGGEVLLSDPFRIIANEFRGWIQQQGWNYEEFSIDLDDDSEHPIRVMRLQTSFQ